MSYNAAPGKVTIGGVTFLSQGPITERLLINRAAMAVETAPAAIPFVTGVGAEITFKPDGRLTLARMNLLFAAATATMGSLLWSSGGCVIHNIDGRKRTYAKAWIVPTFSLNLTTGDTVISQLTIRCTKPDRDTALYADTTLSYDGHAHDNSQVLRPYPTLAFGDASPWDAFHAQNGVSYSLNAELADVTDDSVGVVNQRVTGWNITAQFTPVGPTVAEVQAKLNAAALNAGDNFGTPVDFVASTSNFYLALKSAVMVDAPLSHSARTQTQQPVTLMHYPVQSGADWTAPFVINDND